jgi:hypothetical protein
MYLTPKYASGFRSLGWFPALPVDSCLRFLDNSSEIAGQKIDSTHAPSPLGQICVSAALQAFNFFSHRDDFFKRQIMEKGESGAEE